MTTPHLRGGRAGARRVVLVLHGGREHGHDPTTARQLAYLRMVDFYLGLRRQAESSAVYLLRHRVRGWNADEPDPSPVTDARWALRQLGGRHPGAPIALLGHSMGGRTAFAVADCPGVVGVCALAPWLPGDAALPMRAAEQRFVIAHGAADRTTSPGESRDYARRLHEAGGAVAHFEQPDGRHALLDDPWLWHRFAVGTTLGLVGEREVPRGVRNAWHEHDGLRTTPLEEFDREPAYEE